MDYVTGEKRLNLITTFCPELGKYVIDRYNSDTHEFTIYRFENGYGMHVFKSYGDSRDRLEGIVVIFPDENTTRMQSIFDSEFKEDVLEITSPEELLANLKIVKKWTKGQYLK
nr:MAG TPA: hypothetical protein [Caudoviricetes sp.]